MLPALSAPLPAGWEVYKRMESREFHNIHYGEGGRRCDGTRPVLAATPQPMQSSLPRLER